MGTGKKAEMPPKEKLVRYLAPLGFIDKKEPEQMQYDYAVWPGGLGPRALVRLNDLIDSYNKGVRWGETVVHGGDRLLSRGKETYEECCKLLGLDPADPKVRSAAEKADPRTELDMMKWLWENHPAIPEEMKKSVHFVATADEKFDEDSIPRNKKEIKEKFTLDTEDCNKQWIKEDPSPGSVLLSSGAPYGMAQDEAFWALLKDRGFTIETFGHEASQSLTSEQLINEVAGAIYRINQARQKQN